MRVRAKLMLPFIKTTGNKVVCPLEKELTAEADAKQLQAKQTAAADDAWLEELGL